MFVGVTEFVEGPKGFIPSAIRCEPAHKRLDWFRDVFAATQGPCHFSERPSERKSSDTGISDPCGQGNIEDGTIQSCTQCPNDFSSEVDSRIWDRLRRYDFMNRVARQVRVKLDDLFVRISVPEVSEFGVEFVETFFSPR